MIQSRHGVSVVDRFRSQTKGVQPSGCSPAQQMSTGTPCSDWGGGGQFLFQRCGAVVTNRPRVDGYSGRGMAPTRRDPLRGGIGGPTVHPRREVTTRPLFTASGATASGVRPDHSPVAGIPRPRMAGATGVGGLGKRDHGGIAPKKPPPRGHPQFFLDPDFSLNHQRDLRAGECSEGLEQEGWGAS